MRKIIHTERLVLRPVEVKDAMAVRQIWLDFEASGYACYDMPHRTEPEAVKAQVENWIRRMEKETVYYYATVLERKTIGFCGVWRGERYAEFSYAFCREAQGKGYASEAMNGMMEALAEDGVTRFAAGTAMRNIPSRTMLERLGFTCVQTEQMSFYRNENGEPIYFEGGIFVKLTHEPEC